MSYAHPAIFLVSQLVFIISYILEQFITLLVICFITFLVMAYVFKLSVLYTIFHKKSSTFLEKFYIIFVMTFLAAIINHFVYD